MSIFLILTLFISCQNTTNSKKIIKENKSDSISIKQTIKDTIPIFLEGLSYDKVDGSKFSFEEVKGKVLLLDFWSTRCGPCIKEHPIVVSIEKQIKNNSFQVITISIDRDIVKWKEFIKKNNWQGINLNIDFDPKNPLNRLVYNKTILRGKDTIYPATIPRYFLIDKKLNIIKLDGIKDEKLVSRINSLLND